jgi:hypothetical protein
VRHQVLLEERAVQVAGELEEPDLMVDDEEGLFGIVRVGSFGRQGEWIVEGVGDVRSRSY